MIMGIDAGNSRMKAAYPDATGQPQLLQNERGESWTPSVVYFPPSGLPVVGTEALNMAMADPARVVMNWKRHMGTDDVLYQAEDGTEYRARDILTLLLESVKKDAQAQLGKALDEAVIAVPANYTDKQKQETIDAATAAGITVPTLVHEPTAAAFGNKLHEGSDAFVLVYDLGGGTFDVSLVEKHGNVCEGVATNGIAHCGGQDFNNRVFEKVLDKFEEENGQRPDPASDPLFAQDSAERIEAVKITLSTKESANLVLRSNAMILNWTITRVEFEQLTADLLQDTIDCMLKTLQECGRTPADVGAVYCVGGSSKMPGVVVAVEQALGKKPAQHCEPHYAAAYGAVYAARIECERQHRPFVVNGVALPPPNIHFRDVTAHPIGVAGLTQGKKMVCHEIMAKGAPIPSRQLKVFRLEHPGQTEALIQVLQGHDGQPVEACAKLGEFHLNGLPPRSDTAERIEVDLKLDSSGLLTATARDRESGITAELEITYNNGRNNQGQAA